MGAKTKATRRLRGLGFHPDGDGQWVRSDAPLDRAYQPHRRYGWHLGRFRVTAEKGGGLKLVALRTRFAWSRWKYGIVAEEEILGRGMTLAEVVASVEAALHRQRTSGRLPGWWHLPKSRTGL